MVNPLKPTCVLFFQYIFANKQSEALNSSIYGDVIKLSTVRYCGLGLNCHVTDMTLGVLNERKSGKFIAL